MLALLAATARSIPNDADDDAHDRQEREKDVRARLAEIRRQLPVDPIDPKILDQPEVQGLRNEEKGLEKELAELMEERWRRRARLRGRTGLRTPKPTLKGNWADEKSKRREAEVKAAKEAIQTRDRLRRLVALCGGGLVILLLLIWANCGLNTKGMNKKDDDVEVKPHQRAE
jgi:hypothetical protein